MPRLIDADALKEYLNNRYMDEIFPDWWELPLDTREKIGLLGNTFKQAILNAPTIDAEPVRHGRWEYQWFDSVCSACGFINRAAPITRSRDDSPYCPRCGAKMDGGAK